MKTSLTASFLLFAFICAAQQPALLIQRIFTNPSGNDSPFEFAEMVATRNIDFATEHYTVVFADCNIAGTTNGWATGGNASYGFEIPVSAGTVAAGNFIYVGGSSLSINGSSCKILRQINTATDNGDGFGSPLAAGVLGNGGGNADGLAVFNTTAASITKNTVPVDAVFFGSAAGAAAEAARNFIVPANDLYTGGIFGSNGNTFLAPDPASGEYIYVTSGTFLTNSSSWSAARTWAVNTTKPNCASAPLITLTTGTNLAITPAIVSNYTIVPPFISGVIADPTDPASAGGVEYFVTEDGVGIPTANYAVAATSSKTSVVAANGISIVKGNGQFVIRISPVGVGYTNITITLTKDGNTRTAVINYAASAASATPSATYWHTGVSDGSAAVSINEEFMLNADDETNVLRMYNRSLSGLPISSFNYESFLALPEAGKEVDVEAAVASKRHGGRQYWLGSMSNGSDNSSRPNRNRLFCSQVSSDGINTIYQYISRFDKLREAIIARGDAAGYNFTASAADGKDSKTIDGFNAEGMAIGPDGQLFVGMRTPLVPVSNRKKAVIMQFNGFEDWFDNGASAASLSAGTPIELDLAGRSVRDILQLQNGLYIIIAGDYGSSSLTSSLYKWSGFAADAPVLLPDFDISTLNAEGLMEIADADNKLQVLSDNGDFEFYNDGIISKDLAQSNYKKFRSDIITGNAGSLPIKWLSFSLVNNNSSNLLQWQMAGVGGIANFEVQRSDDGLYFKTIQTIEATSKQTYAAHDVWSNANKLYYRIAANTKDGKTLYTATRFVDAKGSLFSVYPSMINSGGLFTIAAPASHVYTISINAVNGQMTANFRLQNAYTDISTSGWAKGMYLLTIKENGVVVGSEKVIVH